MGRYSQSVCPLLYLLNMSRPKGCHITEEHKRKISEAKKGKRPYLMTDEIKEKMSQSKKGIVPKNNGVSFAVIGKGFSEEHCKNLSKAAKGNPKPNATGNKNSSWKEKPSYRALHHWVNRWKKKPIVCKHCGEIKNRMGWANIDHKYKRVLEDYIFLCPSCHGAYDKENNLRKNKII